MLAATVATIPAIAAVAASCGCVSAFATITKGRGASQEPNPNVAYKGPLWEVMGNPENNGKCFSAKVVLRALSKVFGKF